MMLSPTAARMGLVTTSLRQIGKANVRRISIGTKCVESALFANPNKARLVNTRAVLRSMDLASRRWESTMASFEEDSEDDETISTSLRTLGHAEAAKARAKLAQSHDEAWMINLGRDGNNEWLLKPRDPDDWFTGLKPAVCPGKNYTIGVHFVILHRKL